MCFSRDVAIPLLLEDAAADELGNLHGQYKGGPLTV